MIYFYRLFLYPLALNIFILASFFNKKIKEGLRLRFNPPQALPDTPKDVYWFHCSSGEFEYAKPVISELKNRQPNAYILVTYFTPTQRKVIENYKDVDSSYPLPFDTPAPIIRFLKKVQPKKLLIARTDFWPELLWQTKNHNIPIVMFSCTVSQDKVSSYFKRKIYSWFYNFFDEILVASEQDKINGEKITNKTQWVVCGDSRYDQVVARLNHPNPYKKDLFNSFSGTKFIAGSTWSEDESYLLPVIAKTTKIHNIKFVIAPHEPTPEHLKELTGRLSQLHISYQFYTKSETSWDKDVLIIDTVGILADIYQEVHMAFIGGSFKKSVHSVMEALATGLPVFVGPFHQNNREAIEFSHIPLENQLHMVNVVHNEHDWKDKLELLLEMPQAKNAIKSELDKKIGASQRITEQILRLP